MPTYGKTRDGDLLYWPDKSFLKVDVPAPLEQFLKRIAHRHAYLGQTPQEIAVHFIRHGIIEMMRDHGDAGWTPDHAPYKRLQKGER